MDHPDPAFLAALTEDLVRAGHELGHEIIELRAKIATQDAMLATICAMTEQKEEIKKRLIAGDPSAVEDYRKLVRQFEEVTGRGIGEAR